MTGLAAIDRPDWTRAEVHALASKRQRSRLLIGGTDAVHKAGTAVLPKWGGEEQDAYNVRATLAEVFGAYPRTIAASVGMVFATPPSVEGTIAPELQAILDDMDGQGTAFPIYARRLFESALIDGFAGVLVDFPAIENPSGLSIADAKRQGARPYCVPILASQVINWRVEPVHGRPTLTLLVLAEEIQRPSGAFGLASVCQWRVFRRDPAGVITWELWQRDGEGETASFTLEGTGTLTGPTRIPFHWCPTGRVEAPLVSAPPLDDLAALSVGHYRVSADERYLSHLCHAPTFCITGEPQTFGPEGQLVRRTFKLGPNSLLELTTVGAKAEWVQADPNALSHSRLIRNDQTEQMAALGMTFLARDKSGTQETAEGRRLDGAAEHATLSIAAAALKDCLENAMADVAAYAGGLTAPTVKVTTTYDEGTLDAQTLLALNALAKDGNLPRRELLEILQSGRVLSPDKSIDKLLDELNAQDAAAAMLADKIAAENARAANAANANADPMPKAA